MLFSELTTMRMPCLFLCALFAVATQAAVGDPQLSTSHPWYPGELSCSTFDRLFKTQAELYTRVTGKPVASDEDKALAAWFWRNLNYAHGEEGTCDYWGKGFGKGGDAKNREYWTGLFAMGYGLCGTTHAQWTAELNALLGHGRGRVAGVSGHNSFEAYLTGGAYGEGRWVLLDHDVSTVIFNPEGSRLLSIMEIMPELKTLKDPKFKPERQRGWRVAGLEDSDAAAYSSNGTAEYMAGYASAPPRVHLRSGEKLRRYLKPGLDDGKTFVFWGRNYRAGGIPGPERSRTWVNQPEAMYNSKKGSGYKVGQWRYANAVYDYTPDFATDAYREAVVESDDKHVTFEFVTPYMIACTPQNEKDWGIYDSGASNGLVLKGDAACAIKISTDAGATWNDAGTLNGTLDLTDFVKGHQQYWLRFEAPVSALKGKNVSWRTVCQCNTALIPHLQDGENKITFAASGLATIAAGPSIALAQSKIVDGKFGSPTVTLELTAPRGAIPAHIYATSWQSSGVPPAPVKYQIESSLDGGKSWQPVAKDWVVQRRAPDPPDFWSQSFCYGDAKLDATTAQPVRIRFRNDGGKPYIRCEAQLAYRVANPSPTRVTFAWTEAGGEVKTAENVFTADTDKEQSWKFTAGKAVDTKWVEFAPAK